MIAYLAFGYWLFLWITAGPNSESVIKQSYPQIPAIDFVRARFLEGLSGVSEDAKALVAGLTIGERDLVSTDLEEQMRDLSLTHLVAVSGANLAIVLGSIYFLAAALGLPRNIRFLTALIMMLSYVLLVGPESSVIRAATMALFVMLGIWVGRGSRPIYALSSAIALLLVIDPGLATDVGFGLSAFATAGLVLLTPLIYERFSEKMHKALAAALAATIAAQLYTLPIILYLEPSLPIYSVLANLLVEWAVAPITILGLISVIFSVFCPPIANLFSYLASLGTQWIVAVAGELSNLPFVRTHFLPGAWGIGAAVIIAGASTIWLLGGKLSRQSAAILTAVILVSGFWITTDLFRRQSFAGDWEVYACDVGQGDALLIRSGEEIALVDVGPDPDLLRNCLSDAQVDEISLLVVTHFDADHVAGIEGLREIDIREVLISPFQDERPLVDKAQKLISEKGLASRFGYSGLVGKLGGISWQILNPSPSAREAEDSNDASLVMVFDLGNYSLLALGDLGETGQRRVFVQHQGLLAQLRDRPLVVKVAHHGSADQFDELYEFIAPDVALFLVGENRYGHPTNRAIDLSLRNGATVLRTDKQGPLAIAYESGLRYRVGGKLSV